MIVTSGPCPEQARQQVVRLFDILAHLGVSGGIQADVRHRGIQLRDDLCQLFVDIDLSHRLIHYIRYQVMSDQVRDFDLSHL